MDHSTHGIETPQDNYDKDDNDDSDKDDITITKIRAYPSDP